MQRFLHTHVVEWGGFLSYENYSDFYDTSHQHEKQFLFHLRFKKEEKFIKYL